MPEIEAKRPRVIYVSDDFIFPTNSGGRSLVLAECRSIRALGYDLELVISHREALTSNSDSSHREISDGLHFERRTSFAHTTACRPWLPYQLASRRVSEESARSFRSDAPTVVWAAHEWTLPIAAQISRIGGWPVLLRSHNDELRYMVEMSRSGGIARRAYSILEAIRLKWSLQNLLRIPSAIAVISDADRSGYQGVSSKVSLLRPPLAGSPAPDRPRSTVGRSNVLFVGALDMPHAVHGLLWFVDHAWPLILERVPTARLEVAGRRPGVQLTSDLSRRPGITFHGEVESTADLYDRARVFINPVFAGSGINMKVGPPASQGIPIVTTSVGARGLPNAMTIADSPREYVDACVNLLTSDRYWAEASEKLSVLAQQFSEQQSDSNIKELLERVLHSSEAQPVAGESNDVSNSQAGVGVD